MTAGYIKVSAEETVNKPLTEEMCLKRSQLIVQNIIRNIERKDRKPQDILVMDTGGGRNGTITKRAWRIEHYTNHCTAMLGYQDQGPPKICPVVNAITKARIPGREEPVLIGMNYATLILDENKLKSLCVPFEMMRHGIKIDLTPTTLGGTGKMQIDGNELKLDFDEEKLFWDISMPSDEDMETLEFFELNSPYPNHHAIRRGSKITLPEDIPMVEWRKRLGMVPEDVVIKTLQNTTQYYVTMESENWQDPRRHMKSQTPGLREPRQNKIVASDTFFPSVTSARGNTCTQFFVGINSDMWKVYPLRTESHNGRALQDYTRENGCPIAIKTDNAQSELGETWLQHC